MLIEELIKNKSLPRFITGNKRFRDCKDVKKIFPRIGLANCSEECELDNNGEIEYAALTLVGAMYRVVSHYLDRIGERDTEKYRIYRALYNQFAVGSYNRFISWKNGQASLKLAIDVVVDGKTVFKAGDTLFKVFNHLYDQYKDFDPIDLWEEAKAFNAANVPSSNKKVVFSSDGEDGLWDIATMSMRGFRSCQSWDGSHKAKLIGSMVDPFMGVIYITSGSKTHYGSKMLNRSVVRYVVSSEEKKPYILIDKMYPAYSEAAFKIFEQFLSSRTSLPIMYGPNMYEDEKTKFYIPGSQNTKQLNANTRSYRDTAIEYGSKKAEAYFTRVVSIKTLFGNVALQECYKGNTFNSKNEDISSFLTDMMGQPDFKYKLKQVYRSLAQTIGETIDKKNFTNANEHKKAVLYACFNSNAKNIQKRLITKFVSDINFYYQNICHKHNKRLRSSHLRLLISVIDESLAKALKQDLITVIKRISKNRAILPLP